MNLVATLRKLKLTTSEIECVKNQYIARIERTQLQYRTRGETKSNPNDMSDSDDDMPELEYKKY